MPDKTEIMSDAKTEIPVQKLIDLLNKERDYHSSHPVEVYSKFLYTLGASLAAMITAIYFSSKSSRGDILKNVSNIPIGMVLLFFLAGLAFLLFGFAEHSYIHKQQREKIEDALRNIFDYQETFKYPIFWKNYKQHSLKVFFKVEMQKPTPLFTLEPDTRNYLNFHDRKIDLGAFLITIAYAIMIYYGVIGK